MAAITSAVIGVGLAAYQVYDGVQQKNEAQDAIDNFKPQELVNAQKFVQLDSVKADRQTRANQVNTASSIDALQRAGSRAVLAGVPKINNQSILLQNLIEEDLSKQRQERDIRIARGEERIQAIQEKREQDTLAGLGQQLNVANQNIVNGVTSGVQSGLAVASAVKSNRISKKQEELLDEQIKNAKLPQQGRPSFLQTQNSTTGQNPFTIGVDGDYNLYNSNNYLTGYIA